MARISRLSAARRLTVVGVICAVAGVAVGSEEIFYEITGGGAESAPNPWWSRLFLTETPNAVVARGDCQAASSPEPQPSSLHTQAGVPLPAGWKVRISDSFGTDPGHTVSNFLQLHTRYREGQFYNVDQMGLVRLPNVVINHEQQIYRHFENAIVFAPDHLTIAGRGRPDGSITSAELVSVNGMRNFCVEALYRIPSADKSWPSFWFYAERAGGGVSEIDVEQPITPNQGIHDVTMYNHPKQSSIDIHDQRFTTRWMTWSNPLFDGSAAPHYYTTCYDDRGAGKVTRYIDGREIYAATWKWNEALGGTGHGPDAVAILNLAVGGRWTGNLADPGRYSGDLDIYSVNYYGP